jgi:4-amino-4-deoxy-L-arabinose transferase-like glycosyltransferase
VLVAALFCVPLFVGLGHTDLKGDEPIYSFAVDLILETGDWLTPRSIPYESAPFVEKPPLKFWIIAAGIKSGLLPADEFGHRFWDALFGAAALLYVFAIGVRLAGPVCGVLAAFTLFVHWPLVFEHGVRSNNMEAPLLLAYCGGIYHALAWSTAEGRSRRFHPLAVAAFFVLGFMTKFVAAIFLPFVLVVTAVTFRAWRRRALEDWRAWGAAIALVIVTVVPWFAYQTAVRPQEFWGILLGEHVFKRMTTYLDPAHLQPWHYYFTTFYTEIVRNGTNLLVLVGTAWLLVDTVRKRSAAGTLVLLWAVVPLAAISFGSSKLYHYAYPFLPPLALGAGYLPGVLLSRDSRVRRTAEQLGGRLSARWSALAGDRARPVRTIAMGLAVLAMVVALVTIVHGRFGLRIGDVVIFRNSSVLRPLLLALIMLVLAGAGRVAGALLLATLVLAFVPVEQYRLTTAQLDRRDDSMQVLRRCLDEQQAPGAGGVYVHAEDPGQWRYVYYFRKIGWDHPPERLNRRLIERLFGEQRPVLLTEDDYRAFQGALAEYARTTASNGDASGTAMLEQLRQVQSVTFDDERMMLLPGPYGVCAAELRAAVSRH